MGANALAAELTHASLKADNEVQRREIWKEYDEFADRAIPSLHMMNQVREACSDTHLFFAHEKFRPYSSST